jgi:hypothetical protein
MTEGKALLPEGEILRVSPWRRHALWVIAAAAAALSAFALVQALQGGGAASLPRGLAYAIFAGFLARGAINGVIVEPWGIKARDTFRTYQWRWEEIERFELRAKGETPRFRVHLRNGEVRAFLGFYARAAEEERAWTLFRALEERLEAERAKQRATEGVTR